MWMRSDLAWRKSGTSEPRSTKNTGGGQCRGRTRHSAFSGQRGLGCVWCRTIDDDNREPVAVGLQAGAIRCGLLGAGGKFIGRRLGVKARKHDQIRVLAESKLNTISDRISTALTDDKISEEEFRPILSEVDKYDQMKAEIRRGRQNQGGLSEIEKSSCCTS